MTDKEYAALKERIKGHFDWWIEWLGLGHWEWTLTWDREGLKSTSAPDGYSTHMRISVQPQYMTFDVEIDLPAIKGALDGPRCPDEEVRERFIERLVIHELCHALVSELRPLSFGSDAEDRAWDEWIQHEERVVSQLTLAFIWVANQGNGRPRALADKRRARQRTAAARAKVKVAA